MEKESSFGLEGNEERFEENVQLFMQKVHEFKSKSWDSLQHLADVSTLNSVLLEHFLLLTISYSLNNEKKTKDNYDELISAFNVYKEELLQRLQKQRDNKNDNNTGTP